MLFNQKKDTDTAAKKNKTEPLPPPPEEIKAIPEVKPLPKKTREINTILGQGMRMEATSLVGKGIVQIEGEFHGEVNIEGELLLEKSGYINGNVNTDIASVSGTVTGNIKCGELLHITNTGTVKGDIECKAVLMDKGAVFIGYSKMSEHEHEREVKSRPELKSQPEKFVPDETEVKENGAV